MAMRLITLGTSPADAGTPAGNTIYGIDSNQYLRWYQYLGDGESNPTPGLSGWNAHSGNPIGNGWQAVTWFQLGTAGTLMAIHDDGGLYWYRYTGDGRANPSGGYGWDPLAGTKIDDGWGDYQHVMMFYNDGDEVIMLTVDASGKMLSHFYIHGQGWQPDFATELPGDWSGFTRLIATTSTIFGVQDDGNLYWYQPQWTGSPPVWTMAANSGNQIGTGWDSLHQLVVGGLDDPSRQLHPTLIGIDHAGQLRWFHYTGAGSGAGADWGQNSGNFVSGSW